MSFNYQYSAIEARNSSRRLQTGGGGAPSIASSMERDPDALATFGGSILEPFEYICNKLQGVVAELNGEECSVLMCGLFCSPCVIGEAIEQAGEGNFWVHCNAVLFAHQFACLPLCCFTVPAMNRISVRLGGEPNWARNFLYVSACRPCAACQLHKAVKEGRMQGRLGTPRRATAAAPNAGGGGAPVIAEDMATTST